MFHISKSIIIKFWICLSPPLWGSTIWESPNLPLKFEFSPPKVFFSYFSQSSKISTGHVFHLFKLKFHVVTSWVLLCKRKILKKNKKNCRVLNCVVRKLNWFVSRFHQIIVTRTFQKIGPHLFSSSGNESFRHTVRFTSNLSFECSYVHPKSLVPYCFHVLQPIRAMAFAYFSFKVHSVEFVSWSRSCC